jgi:GTP-binding protein
LRQTFDLPGVPIRISKKVSENPYEGRRSPQR